MFTFMAGLINCETFRLCRAKENFIPAQVNIQYPVDAKVKVDVNALRAYFEIYTHIWCKPRLRENPCKPW